MQFYDGDGTARYLARLIHYMPEYLWAEKLCAVFAVGQLLFCYIFVIMVSGHNTAMNKAIEEDDYERRV